MYDKAKFGFARNANEIIFIYLNVFILDVFVSRRRSFISHSVVSVFATK